MNHTLHHLRWLLWRFRFPLAGYAVCWAALVVWVWRMPASEDAWKFIVPATGGLLLFGAFVLLDAVWQDHAPGTDTFWRTRPPRWRAVWASQLLFGLTVCTPPAAGWLVNGLLMRNTGAQWLQAAPELLLFAGPLFAVAGLASFARRWPAYTLTLVLAVACWMGGRESFLGMLDPTPGTTTIRNVSRDTVWLLTALLMLLTLLLCWAAGMRRPRVWRRAVAAGVAFVAAPFLAFQLAPAVADDSITLDIAVRGEGFVPQSGDQSAGDLVLRGVPSGSVAVMTWSEMGVAAAADGIAQSSEPISYPRGPYRVPGWFLFNHTHGLPNNMLGRARVDSTKVAGQFIRGLLPGGARWYKNDPGISQWTPDSGQLIIGNEDAASVEPPPLWLKGEAGGVFLSATRLVSIPLAAGAGGAGCGCRVRLERLEYSGESLAFTASLWLASRGVSPIQPEGKTISGFLAESALPVLYFPAVPMAILLTQESQSGAMRPWQCIAQRIATAVRMPDAESVNGAAFTAETLRGAELILCAPLVTGTFRVRLPEGPQQFRRRAGGSGETAIRIELERFSQPAEIAGHNLEQRAELLRRILKLPGGYWFSHYGPRREVPWWTWLTDDLVPDLTAAVRRNAKWMNLAWKAGQETKLRPVALELVRTVQKPLPASVVASAAAIARPEDYATLSRHAMLAIVEGGIADPCPSSELFRRLRALPGFDWKRPVLARWLADSQSNNNDRAAVFASLAGSTEALQAALSNSTLMKEHLTLAERDELFALIEDLPPAGPERDAWLESNFNFLTWDEARGKYVP